jgi:hypothetical protein
MVKYFDCNTIPIYIHPGQNYNFNEYIREGHSGLRGGHGAYIERIVQNHNHLGSGFRYYRQTKEVKKKLRKKKPDSTEWRGGGGRGGEKPHKQRHASKQTHIYEKRFPGRHRCRQP